MIAEEAWRIIPPEEKLEIMAKSHATGVRSATALALLGGTLAISFQLPIVFWGALIASPIVFQFTSSKKWRSLRPVALLQYLAARSVTRRYAYAINSLDLNMVLLFRGSLTHLVATEGSSLTTSDMTPVGPPAEVWVALFPDSVVIISERKGGASLEFGHVINKRFDCHAIASDKREYSQNLKVIMQYDDLRFGNHRVVLESRFPAAINAFAKRLKEFCEIPRSNRVDYEQEEFSGAVRDTGDALQF